MRDRLIELLEQAKTEALSTIGSLNNGFGAWYADYILKDGWIRHPVKLNQILYKPYTYRNAIDECRVSAIIQKSDGTFKIRLTNLYYRAVFEVTEDDFGKTVFLTKEEAEQSLKGSAE